MQNSLSLCNQNLTEAFLIKSDRSKLRLSTKKKAKSFLSCLKQQLMFTPNIKKPTKYTVYKKFANCAMMYFFFCILYPVAQEFFSLLRLIVKQPSQSPHCLGQSMNHNSQLYYFANVALQNQHFKTQTSETVNHLCHHNWATFSLGSAYLNNNLELVS